MQRAKNANPQPNIADENLSKAFLQFNKLHSSNGLNKLIEKLSSCQLYLLGRQLSHITMRGSYSAILSQPFPTYRQHKKQMIVCFIAAITVFLTLYILEPFNINLLNAKQKLIYALTYSSITLVTCLFLTVLCPYLFPNFFHDTNWTVGKEICYVFFILVVISGLNLIAHNIVDNIPINIKEFFISLKYTLPLAAFPVSFSILVKQKWLKEKYKKEATLWNNILREYQTNTSIQKGVNHEVATVNNSDNWESEIKAEPDSLVITGTGIGEVLEIKTDDLLLISSADNYITIYYKAHETIKSYLIRNTLKSTEAKTQHIKAIVRCHRSYIVNLNKVERIVGDAQGLKLLVEGIEEPISVGSSYLENVKKLLQSRNRN